MGNLAVAEFNFAVSYDFIIVKNLPFNVTRIVLTPRKTLELDLKSQNQAMR